MKEVRILVADQSASVRRRAKSLLSQQPHWHVVAEVVEGEELLAKCRQTKPQVVLLDSALPRLGGLEAARQIGKVLPETKIIVMSMNEAEEPIRSSLEAGVRGYVLKLDLDRKIVAAVRAACSGLWFFDYEISEIVTKGYLERAAGRVDIREGIAPLTVRELEIARLLALGHGNRQISSMLGIRVRTVETHRANIMRKLNLHTLAELIHFAVAKGMIHIRAKSAVGGLGKYGRE